MTTLDCRLSLVHSGHRTHVAACTMRGCAALMIEISWPEREDHLGEHGLARALECWQQGALERRLEALLQRLCQGAAHLRCQRALQRCLNRKGSVPSQLDSCEPGSSGVRQHARECTDENQEMQGIVDTGANGEQTKAYAAFDLVARTKGLTCRMGPESSRGRASATAACEAALQASPTRLCMPAKVACTCGRHKATLSWSLNGSVPVHALGGNPARLQRLPAPGEEHAGKVQLQVGQN